MATLFGPETFTGSNGATVTSITTMPSPGSNTGSSITVQGNRGRWHTGTATNYLGRVAGRLLSSVGDFELTLTFRFDGSECYPGVYWKTDANCEGRDGYDLRFWPGENWTLAAVDEWGLVGGAPLATVTLPFASNADYKVRLRVIGTNIKARVWLATDSEPATWGADVTNSYYTAAGPLYLANSGGTSANGIMYYDDVTVTDGSTATVQDGSATLSTASALSATGLVTKVAGATLGTVSQINATGGDPPVQGTATLGTTSELTATGQTVKPGVVTLSTTSALTASPGATVVNGAVTLGTVSELFAFVAPDGGTFSDRDGTYSSGEFGGGAYGGIEFSLSDGGEFQSDDTLIFSPPARGIRLDTSHTLFRRVSYPVPYSILQYGTSFQQIESPSDEEMRAATRVFLGGHDYRVDGYTASLLALAGYGEWLTRLPSRLLYPALTLWPANELYPGEQVAV